jgi:hypothetical protein
MAKFMRIAIDDTRMTFDTQFGKQLPLINLSLGP